MPSAEEGRMLLQYKEVTFLLERTVQDTWGSSTPYYTIVKVIGGSPWYKRHYLNTVWRPGWSPQWYRGGFRAIIMAIRSREVAIANANSQQS